MTTEAIKNAILAEMADGNTTLLHAELKVLNHLSELVNVAVEEIKQQLTGGGVSPAGKVNEMEEYHSRFDQDHIAECSDCYEAALDFAMEQEDDARLDAMAEASELEEA